MQKNVNVRKMAMTAVLAAVASVLMFISFSVPLMPGFVTLDFSELPALIASFSMGPLSGVAVCFLKNLVHLLGTSTGGVGELCNFLLASGFVLPAGLVYKKWNSRGGALFGSLLGTLLMAAFSLPVNYFVAYPFYTAFLSMDMILGMYRAINPAVNSLFDALLWFNVPFTFLKGLFSVVITFLIYKKISPLIKGKA